MCVCVCVYVCMCVCVCVMCPSSALLVHNVLLDVMGVRSSALVGGLIMSLGIMLGTFADSVPFLIVTLGVLVGECCTCCLAT